ncbi:glycosyltransferase family 4 protein [Pseudomonas sp. R5(2019)]|uniref:glycosyltransferase family 4 protein n=1 Tax=Pseudomonas sp. R5(2019) TaxID=2697566 RepID=UPI001411F626|nr:glycosyltransferase family 4 protein [Pseudomonas sp. R5(2019)]NBA98230.1 glycosyltransferase [Pseudomonas sp. R5(2019)]
MNILIVSPDFPYPPNHGGRVDIWKRIELLHSQGHALELIATTNSTISETDLNHVKRYVKNTIIVRRETSIWKLLTPFPYQVLSRENLSKTTISKSYDCVILESESVSPIIKSIRGKTKALFLRIHNNETAYFRSLRKSTKNIVLKIFYLREQLLYSKHSREVKKQCDKILHISKDEYETDKLGQEHKTVFLPSHVSPGDFKDYSSKETSKVLFVGNLFTENNLAGLHWYVKNVHPALIARSKAYELIVAGNTRGTKPQFLDNVDAVKFIDSPADLNPHYAEAAVFINPMLSGAGVKLKTINAIQEAIPVVSTTTGAEGIGLVDGLHFMLADDVESFANAVHSLLENSELRKNIAIEAQEYVKKHFNATQTYGTLLNDHPII